MSALQHLRKSVPGFTYTQAIKKLRKMKKRYRVVPGGTSAGKTFGISPILMDRAIKTPGLEISIVSESIPHLRKGALKDFLKIMKATGRYIDAHYNRTFLTYTFSNGSVIEFFSADQEDKVKGPRRNVLYVNECNNLKFDTFHQLAIRTDGEIWLDYNPSREFWVQTELPETDPDVEYLILTYKDNEALSESIIKEIEKAKYKGFFNPDLPMPELINETNIKSDYWSNWWLVYGLGLTGSLEGQILTDWSIVKQIPKDARLIGYAMDFGFDNDPSTLIGAFSYEGKVYWKEYFYETGLKTRDIARKMKEAGVRSTDFVVADRSNGRLITEINEFGFNVRKANQDPGTIELGIEILQQDHFYITEDSLNFINELRNYLYKKDKKTGKFTNEPIDDFNHCIDPQRYLGFAKLTKQKSRRKGLRRRN